VQSARRDELSFELHFGVDLAESDVLDTLQTSLTAGRGFSHSLRALSVERDRAPLSVGLDVPGSVREAVVMKGTQSGPTYRALVAADPPTHHRRFGHALLRGSPPSTFLVIDFDEYVPCRPSGDQWLFSNTVGGWIGAGTIARISRTDWVLSLVERLGEHPQLLWGAAFVGSEFSERNLHNDADGMWALGRDVRRCLPGVFWLNVFGSAYVHTIGEQQIRTVPTGTVHALGDNLMVQVYSGPEEWSTEDGRARHEQVVGHLGQRFFFDRINPDRPTTAPDFGLEPLKQRKPFQVRTTDGKRITPFE
jgi:hypothetical protein